MNIHTSVGDKFQYSVEDYICIFVVIDKFNYTIIIRFRTALEKGLNTDHVLVLECDSGHKNGNLISCCRYRIVDLLSKDELSRSMTCILFLIHIPRNYPKSNFVSFQEQPWKCYHVDELISKQDSFTVTDLVIADYSIAEAFSTETPEEFDHPASISYGHGEFYCTIYSSLFPKLLQYSKKAIKLYEQLYDFIPEAVSSSMLKRDRIQILQDILSENQTRMGTLKR